MEELKKIHRITERELGRPADETLLVLDATTGQNAISQAKQFSNAVPLTGIALAKLDGTARGGIVITLADELKIPNQTYRRRRETGRPPVVRPRRLCRQPL